MELEFYKELYESFGIGDQAPAAASSPDSQVQRGQFNDGESQQGNSNYAGQPQLPKAKRFGQSMLENYGDGVKRAKIMDAIKAELARMKIGSSDISPLLFSTLSPREAFLINREVVFLNLLRSIPGAPLVVDDWVYRIPMRRQTAPMASRVNPEGTIVGLPIHETTRSQMDNTLAFWGDPIQVSFIAKSQADQQQNVALMAQEVDAMMAAIQKRQNYDYLNGQEQKNFIAPNVPQVGGLLERSISNTIDAGAGDITETHLETANDALGALIGFQAQKVLLGTPRTVGAIRTIEIDRYGGNDPRSHADHQAVLAAQLAKYGLSTNRVYEPDNGPPIPVFQVDALENTAVLLVIEPAYAPREARFKIGGEFGPWMFTQYNMLDNLNDGSFVMNGGTLDDPFENLRHVFENTK